jgi:uncharacterized protein YbaP (TraB family)
MRRDPPLPSPQVAMTRFLPSLALVLALFSTPALAMCEGRNLFETMDPDRLDRLRAATDAVPFPTGNYWRATRGDEVITIIGTYHFDDPRHFPTLDAIAPEIAAAETVLVEAGPDEQAQLMQTLADEPGRMFITEGPTLIERLPPQVWADLKTALEARGVPGIMAAKFQPWNVVAVLSIPPCAMLTMQGEPKGLDGLVIDEALANGVPVRGLEPHDTIFRIFDSFTEAEMVAMIESTLAIEDKAEDYSATLADSYFGEDVRMIWEFMRDESYALPGYTPEQVDAEYARFEEVLMNMRNRAWIPVLTEAAKEGPVFTAFGALHLAGEEGVLNLLQDIGFTLERLPL